MPYHYSVAPLSSQGIAGLACAFLHPFCHQPGLVLLGARYLADAFVRSSWRGKANAKGKDIILTAEKGGMSKVTIADVNQSNGVIHVVDTRPSSQLTTRGSVTLPSERHESNVLITQSRD
jgi:hypothetical protein